MGKRIIYVRHSKTDEKRLCLSQEGIDLAVSASAKILHNYNSVQLIFTSSAPRAIQTAMIFSMQIAAREKVMPILKPHVDILLPPKAFLAEINTQEVEDLEAKGVDYIEAILTCHPEAIKKYLREAIDGVREMFAKMNDGDAALAFGHAPYINFAALEIDPSRPKVMTKECEGFVFEEIEGGYFVHYF